MTTDTYEMPNGDAEDYIARYGDELGPDDIYESERSSEI
jgi:hypothetical protein